MQIHESAVSYIPIKDQSGTEYGQLYFIATDPGFYARFVEKQSALLSIFDSVKKGILSNGPDADTASVVDEASRQFAELIDYICGVRTSELVFAKLKPFDYTHSGETCAAIVLAGLSEAKTSVTRNIRILETKMDVKGGKMKWKKRK